MAKLIALILGLALSYGAIASQEGVIPFSEFTIRSNGIGQSGPVEVVGSKGEDGNFSSFVVNAFGKSYSLPSDLLKAIPAVHQNGIQLTYEAGYPNVGGRTIYIQFQKGFTSGIQSIFVVSLNEKGIFEVLGE